jgi:excinuclease ABC subunit B
VREIDKRVQSGERVLVTTLTKRMAEELSEYLHERKTKVTYLHSEIDTIQRVEILNNLRRGRFDVLVGVNLLREGLDLPEVSLVAIMDADKEGFLRSTTSLIQTIGRTARHVNAEVILFADVVTDSMKQAIRETDRRRGLQMEHNRLHNVKPETVRKAIRRGIEDEMRTREVLRSMVGESEEQYVAREAITELEEEMRAAANELDFERAGYLRDKILQVQKQGGLAPEAWRPTKAREKARRKKRRGGWPSGFGARM